MKIMESRLILLVFMLLITEIQSQICWIPGCDRCDGQFAFCTTNQTGNIVPTGLSNSTLSIGITYNGPATVLRNSTLKHFPNLMVFMISGNIVEIEDGTFVGNSLEMVDISNTHVERLPDKAFGENSNVTDLQLGNTRLKSIPTNIFKHLPNLEILDLSYNPIKDMCSMVNIGEQFRELKQLNDLYLSGLAMSEDCTNVSEHYLEPLSHLTGMLTLSDSGLFHGSQKILKPLINMVELVINNLSPYKECPNQARELLANLPNSLTLITMKYWQTTSPLNVSCQITNITVEGLKVLRSLSGLDFSYGSGIFGHTLTKSLLGGLDLAQAKNHWSSNILDLSWCQFSKIESGALNNLHLKFLYLNGNQLGSRDLVAFNGDGPLSSQLYLLGLNDAQLSSLGSYSFIYDAAPILNSFPGLSYLELGNNNIYNVPRFFTQGEYMVCDLGCLDLSGNELDSLDSKEMRDICMNCELWYFSVENNRIASVLGILYCRQLHYLNLKTNLLGYGNQNDTFAVLQQLSRLQQLDLGSNGLTYVPAALFADMKLLEMVKLEDNRITSMDNVNFGGSPELYNLSLSSNQLTSFSINIIETNRNLCRLYLDNNHIREFSSLLIDFVEKNLTDLYYISASGNPFDCSCGKLQFQSWVSYSTKLVDGKNLVCETPETLLGHPVYKYKESYFDCQVKLPLIIVCSIVGGGILIALVSTRCYRYRWYMSHIRVVLGAVAVAAKSAKTIDECKYDVMICVDKSSDSDVDWVITKLLPELEGGEYTTVDTAVPDDRKNRVYLHMRDAVPGGYRVEILCEAMKQSRKIIIILSNSFLENAECMSEAVYAREELYSTRTYKPGRVMVIILEELREDLLLGSPVSGLLTEHVIDLQERLRTDSNTHRMNRIWKRIHKFVDKEKWIVYQKRPTPRSDGYEQI